MMKRTGKFTIHFLTYILVEILLAIWLPFFLCVTSTNLCVLHSYRISSIFLISSLSFVALVGTLLLSAYNVHNKKIKSMQRASNCHCIFANRTKPLIGRCVSTDTISSSQYTHLCHSSK